MTEETKVEQPKEEPKNDFAERLAALEATNKRLLDESKGYKEKYQKIRDEVSTKEKEALEKAGSKDELIERIKQEAFEASQKLTEMKKKALEKELKFEVAKHASDAHKIDSVLRALPKQFLQLDEENLSVNGVKEAIDHLRKEESYLFKVSAPPSTVNQRPATMVVGKKSVSELTANEQKDRLKEALSNLIP